MKTGGFAHSAPSGFEGILTYGLDGWETNMENAIILPSGDQDRPPGDLVKFVSINVCPVSIHRTKSWTEPSPVEA